MVMKSVRDHVFINNMMTLYLNLHKLVYNVHNIAPLTWRGYVCSISIWLDLGLMKDHGQQARASENFAGPVILKHHGIICQYIF